jgi:hypothetical protein
MNFICLALVFSLLYKLSVEGATIGVWAYSSTCIGDPYKVYNAYSDLCTARNGVAITLKECSASSVKMITYEDSESEKVNAPKCGTGQGSYIDASTSCTQFSNIGYVKLIENTCKAPSTVFIANPNLYTCTSERYQQKYLTITADGTCRSLNGYVSGFAYTSSVGSSNTVDFKIFKSSICNQSFVDTVWTGIPTTGVCTSASPPKEFEALSVSVPATFSFSIASILGGAIAGAVIGTLVCCCGCWGALHACGVVNCPCFNRCCDRRKNIASSSSNSFPSTAYATQAPRSSPYGNARL